MLIPAFLDGLAERLRTIDGLTATTDPGATIAVDMVTVAESDIEYHSTFGRGYDAVGFTVTLYVSAADTAEGVSHARNYKSGHGDLSLRAAIETSTGATDALDDVPSIVCVSARTDYATRPDGAAFVTVVVDGTAQLSGS